MRTTVSISDELLTAAKRLAHERGQALGQVIESALRRELAVPRQRVSGRPFPSSAEALGRGPVSTSPQTGPCAR